MAVDAARAKSLFLAASDLSGPAERAAYLARECGGDAELRRRVEALLRANDASPLPPSGSGDAAGAHAADRRLETEDYGDPTARVGSVLAGRYKLIEEIGEGGMGSVYLAQQTEPVKRAVAVKVIKAGMDSKAVLVRFEAERQALAMMDHPNIAKVLDAGTTDGGRPFFVMELVKGTPITQFCDDRKLNPRQRLELFIPVCQAIQHAHQKGVIHRDVKPSNVLVAMYDDRPVPKVIDFGVAKAAGQTLTDKTLMTGFGAVVGTLEYMSPEQASLNNLDIDTRSDVYSLGVLLYELLTGSTPVDRKALGQAALLELLRVVREVEAPRPSARLSTVATLPSVAANRGTEPARLSKLMKGELDWLVLKALEKDRTRRYETANGFAADVQRYLAGEPVLAAPPGARYRLRKFAWRHRAALATAAALALLLIAGVAVSTWQAVRATRAEAAALQAQQAEAERAGGERLAKLDAQAKQAEAEKQQARAEADETLASDEMTLVLAVMLRRFKDRLGPEDPDTIAVMNQLTLGYLAAAAHQAWYRRDKELAATCGHALDLANESDDPITLERAAKVCSLRPTGDASRLAVSLLLARKSVERGRDHPLLPWFQLTLGMAEYRSGHFPEADAALIACAGDEREALTDTGAFYRAMSLFRQAKPDEARRFANAAAAKMKPLPKDEKDPLADKADHNDLILWMAYKEAKELIGFDASPAAASRKNASPPREKK